MTESSRINPGQHLSTGLHYTRSSIETHGLRRQSLTPFPEITTEDRECAMRLILLLSFFEEGGPFPMEKAAL
ncbi:hypothetical protein [Arthrobacter sp. UYEF3]|uniref:hypothetical protein n=1 Tax=Arthrobacter sp. UYEF3 TaxID=1756365 RepID=UPI00339916C0